MKFVFAIATIALALPSAFSESLRELTGRSNCLKLSDGELWDLALHGRIGKYCYIQDARNGDGVCRYYAKAIPDINRGDAGGHDGTPEGTGCIYDRKGPACFFESPVKVELTQEEMDSMCTSSKIKNGAAQLRYALENGLCTDPGKRARC